MKRTSSKIKTKQKAQSRSLSKQDEATLRESEERYHNLFNSIGEGFCIIEMIFDEQEKPVDFRYLEVNPAFERQSGLREATGRRALELTPNLETYWFEIYGKIAQTGIPVRLVNEVKSLNRWFDVHAFRLCGPGSKKIAIHFNNITERKRAEEALRQSEELHRGVTQSLSEGLLLTDLDDVITDVNPRMLEMTGYTREELLGQRALELLVPPEDHLRMRTRNQQRAAGLNEHYEQRLRRKDGSEFFALIAGSPLRDQHGKVIGTIGANLDITERKKAERQLAAFANLGRRLGGATKVAKACRLIVEVADELFGWDACTLVLYDNTTHLCRAAFNMDLINGQRMEVPSAYEDRDPSPRLRQIMETGAELILREEPICGSPDLVPFGERSRPSASLMFVPIRDDQKIIGVFSIQSYRLHAYIQEDLNTLQALADHCGGALARIQSRESQRLSETKYRTLIERMGEGLLQVDDNDIIAFVNPQICRMLGYAEAELLGQHAATLLCREEDRTAMEDRNYHRTQGISEGYEIQLRKKSGEFLLTWIAATPMTIANGQFSGSMAILTDITERKQNEEELKMMRFSVDRAGDGVVWVSHNGRILYANDAYCTARGYSREELLRMKISDLNLDFPPEVWKPHFEELKQRGTITLETRHRAKDGRVFPVEVNANYVHLGDKEFNFAFVRDITERKRAEAAAQRTNARLLLHSKGVVKLSQAEAVAAGELDRALAGITEIAAETLQTGRVSVWFFNASRDSIRVHDLYDFAKNRHLSGIELRTRDYPNYFAALESGEVISANNALTDPRTCEFAESYLKLLGITAMLDTPIRWRGNIVGVVCHEHLVTPRQWEADEAAFAVTVAGIVATALEARERKLAEEALRKSQEEIYQHATKLEEAVSERTMKLTDAIGELEAFSYSIAHDMRAPLRAMQNFSSILLSDYAGNLDAEAVSYLEKIKSASERQDNLIQDALIYSRVVRADMPLEPVNLHKLASEIIEMYLHINSPLTKITIQGKLPTVLGNAAGLTKSISNLLDNGVKFVAPGIQPQLTLRAEEIGDDALIWIEDNGVGIEPSDLERIFKMFERTYTARSYDGTGIGLAIVRKAVERMHGKVGVESEPGKGSRFWIQLKKA